MKKFLIVLIVFLNLFIPVQAEDSANDNVLPSEIGQVLSVENVNNFSDVASAGIKNTKQSVELKILTGEHKGEKVFTDNMLMGNPVYDINLKKNDKVILHVEEEKGALNYFIADKYRVHVLYFLAGLFILLILITGGKKGFRSLISIFITLGLIFKVLTPLILHGANPLLATVLICLLASVAAIYLVGGINYKSSAAILGTVFSLILAGLLSILCVKWASLTGFSTEESLFLYTAHPNLDFIGILTSAILIGALGAVMDIGMSISSTINEIYSTNSQKNIKELFISGMNVGKDIIGTMANTLILAYLGGALFLVLLASNIDLQKFFNLNQVVTEITSALIGSVAIVLCVPITAIIAACLIRHSKKDF